MSDYTKDLVLFKTYDVRKDRIVYRVEAIEPEDTYANRVPAYSIVLDQVSEADLKALEEAIDNWDRRKWDNPNG